MSVDTLSVSALDLDDAGSVDLRIRTRVAGMLTRSPWTWWWAAVSATSTLAFTMGRFDAMTLTLLVVTAAGAGALGYIDQRTQLILNRHTLTLLVIAAALIVAVEVAGERSAPILTAVAAAVLSFVVMIALCFLTGFASGGDIKLVPVIAAPLAVISPLTAAIWLMVTFLLSLVLVAGRAAVLRSAPVSAPMAPLMAAAIPVSIAVTTAIYGVAGFQL